jgi:hypothetical protein
MIAPPYDHVTTTRCTACGSSDVTLVVQIRESECHECGCVTHWRHCLWFALCENESTCFVDHPVLGPVPCCDRCALLAGGI